VIEIYPLSRHWKKALFLVSFALICAVVVVLHGWQ
jgi:hypothetical protein